MANVRGRQPDVRFCPACRADLRNVPRSEMPPRRHPDGRLVTEPTHTYECTACRRRFEINQDR